MNQAIVYACMTLYGLVQGIGFRPYVVRLAQKWGIQGEVCNLGGAVKILAAAPFSHLEGFFGELISNPPPLSEIIYAKKSGLNAKEYEDSLTSRTARVGGFRIVESGEHSEGLVILPADLPVCEACLHEMHDPENRRYRHPLISCTLCGPRYSVIMKAPYDRANTALEAFVLCSECQKEYTSVDSRRFHAQTISCHNCGPQISLKVRAGQMGHKSIYAAGNQHDNLFEPGSAGAEDPAAYAPDIYYGDEALSKAMELLQHHKVIAVKGIGGYHYIADPYSNEAVESLRILKQRDMKPFAVCFGGMEEIRSHARVSQEEERLLLSKAHPIVLLEKQDASQIRPFSSLVMQNSRYIGAFLPYTPILVRLCEDYGPIIATSANLSDAPIINEDETIMAVDSPLLSAVLTHDRDIIVSEDDSVAWVVHGKPQLLRRARGYTPLPVFISSFEDQSGQVLALGGELKSAFCLQKGPFAYMSQYLGDLKSPEALRIYLENLDHMKKLLNINPEIIACDLHPNYATTRLAEEMGLPLVRVQHHHAHIAAVMAEKGINGPVLGASFDGTGYGSDGSIWGGEFLICENAGFIRAGHLKPIPMLMGDESMKDCKKAATAYLHALGFAHAIQDDRYPVIKSALEHNINTLPSSSAGRLFDAVSSLLGLCHVNRYEGEGAILLENAAYRGKVRNLAPYPMDFDIIKEEERLVLDSKPIVKALIKGIGEGSLIEELALGFHEALSWGISGIITELGEKTGIKNVVLSGGVFQNKLLTEKTSRLLEARGFSVHLPGTIPPNDAGISLGQAYVAMKKYREG